MKTIMKESRKFELTCLKKRRKKKRKRKKKKKKKKEEAEKKKKQTFWPSVDFLVRYFCNAFVPLGVLFVMKTLEDEQ